MTKPPRKNRLSCLCDCPAVVEHLLIHVKPEQIEQAKFVQSCLDDMSGTWQQVLSDILTMLSYGFSFLEIVYKSRDGEQSKYNDSKIGWKKFAIRNQAKRKRWEFDDQGGVQGCYFESTLSQEVFIPIEKALLFRTAGEYGNPEGKSVLRNSYTY